MLNLLPSSDPPRDPACQATRRGMWSDAAKTVYSRENESSCLDHSRSSRNSSPVIVLGQPSVSSLFFEALTGGTAWLVHSTAHRPVPLLLVGVHTPNNGTSRTFPQHAMHDWGCSFQ